MQFEHYILLAHLFINFVCVAVAVQNKIGHAVGYILGFVAVAVPKLGFPMWLLKYLVALQLQVKNLRFSMWPL